MGSDREMSKYVGGHPQTGGKRAATSKNRRSSARGAKGRSSSDKLSPRAPETVKPSQKSAGDFAGAPEIYVPPGERQELAMDAESEVPTAPRREAIRNELEAVRDMETEFFQTRDDTVLQLERCLEVLQSLEDDLARRSGHVIGSRKDIMHALDRVTSIREEDWDPDNVDSECGQAMRVIADARMEWKRCVLRWPEIRRGQEADPMRLEDGTGAPLASLPLTQHNLAYLCRMGFAMTWPIGLALLIVGTLFVIFAN